MAIPDADAAAAAFREAEREQAFWEQHYREYIEKYPDRFVAVHDGKVVATSEDLYHLVILLREQGLAPTDVWMEYIEATPRELLL